jgi:hypothetical protein
MAAAIGLCCKPRSTAHLGLVSLIRGWGTGRRTGLAGGGAERTCPFNAAWVDHY